MSDPILLAGTASRDLARAVAAELETSPGKSTVERFPDGEVMVRLGESVRDRDVFLVQATAPPVDANLVELLATADACWRAAAGRITAVVPYFGYARADRRMGRREPIMASVVARLIETAGVRHVVTVDVHSPYLEGFFRVPVDNVSAIPTLAAVVADDLPDDVVIVSPDLGGVERATTFAAHVDRPVAVLHKRRWSGTRVEITRVIGDVRDRPCVLVDDMIATGGTIAEGVRALVEAGARTGFRVIATHGVFTGPARERLAGDEIAEIVVTDTLPIDREVWPEVRVVSVAPLLAEVIRRLARGRSLRDMN